MATTFQQHFSLINNRKDDARMEQIKHPAQSVTYTGEEPEADFVNTPTSAYWWKRVDAAKAELAQMGYGEQAEAFYKEQLRAFTSPMQITHLLQAQILKQKAAALEDECTCKDFPDERGGYLCPHCQKVMDRIDADDLHF